MALQERVVPVYQFKMPNEWEKTLPGLLDTDPDLRRRSFLETVGRFFLKPFRAFQTYIFKGGFVTVLSGDKEKQLLLDCRGWFSNEAQDIAQVATTASRWELP